MQPRDTDDTDKPRRTPRAASTTARARVRKAADEAEAQAALDTIPVADSVEQAPAPIANGAAAATPAAVIDASAADAAASGQEAVQNVQAAPRRVPRDRPGNGARRSDQQGQTRRRQDRDRPRPERQRIGPVDDDAGDDAAADAGQRRLINQQLPPELENVDIPWLEGLNRDDAAKLAETLGMPNAAIYRRDDLVHRAIQALGERGGVINASGILETTNDGYGFIRHRNLRHNINDVYVAQSQIRRFGIRTGDFVTGQVRSPKTGEKYYGMLRVDMVSGLDPETARRRPPFDQLTALFPDKLYDLETDQKAVAARLLNLIAPIGMGQRALIVSPPKAGKTILLHQIAEALTTRYPETHVMAALIGERPEEVTDWERTVKGVEVISSTFDEPVEEHTRVAEIVLARAKRLVEAGRHVVILLDSITRLARAYNIAAPSSGRTLSGGMDPVALYPPKHFFGAARNTEEAGTLTIVATCLVDTGSRLDELIYEEFKGTGNMEVHLDRRLAERRIYPAVDVLKSSTRRDERLYDGPTYRGIVTLRRMLAMLSNSNLDSSDAAERILDRLSKTKTNAEFIGTLSKEI